MITDNMWVTVRYSLFDSSGEPLETGEREVTYLHGGYGAIFEQLEQALAGKSTGDTLSVYLQPEDSFGDYDPELVRLAPRSAFPAEIEEGMTFEGIPGEPPDGLMYIATDIAGDSVVLDANHPLAGMSVRFEMEVVDVRPASAEEIADEVQRARDDDEPDAPRVIH